MVTEWKVDMEVNVEIRWQYMIRNRDRKRGEGGVRDKNIAAKVMTEKKSKIRPR